jgi:hypothetical protein
MLHFANVPPEKLPIALINSQILKAYKRAVTMGMTYPQMETITLVSGTYDLANITDFYEPRWYEYSGDKLRKMQYEHISSVPTVTNDTPRYYYQKDKNFYVVNGDVEDIDVYYWAYPPAITSDTATLTALSDEFSGVITSRVSWIISQGMNPKAVSGYIASYNEEFKVMKQFYIKKHQTGRGYVMPMDY